MPLPDDRGLAPVRVKDTRDEIRAPLASALVDDDDAVGARAVMTIADAPRELVQVSDPGQTLRFKDDVIVAEALKFYELHFENSDE